MNNEARFDRIWQTVKDNAHKVLNKYANEYGSNHTDDSELSCGEYTARIFNPKSKFIKHLHDRGILYAGNHPLFFDICFEQVIENTQVYGFIQELVMDMVVKTLNDNNIESLLICLEKCIKPSNLDTNLGESIEDRYGHEKDPSAIWNEAKRHTEAYIERYMDKHGFNDDGSVGDDRITDDFYVRIHEINSDLVLYLENNDIGKYTDDGRYYDISFDEITDLTAFGYIQEDALEAFISILDDNYIKSVVEKKEALDEDSMNDVDRDAFNAELDDRIEQIFRKLDDSSERIEQFYDRKSEEINLNEDETQQDYDNIFLQAQNDAVMAVNNYFNNNEESFNTLGKDLSIFFYYHIPFQKYLQMNNKGYMIRMPSLRYALDFKHIMPEGYEFADTLDYDAQMKGFGAFYKVLSRNGINSEIAIKMPDRRTELE